MAREATIPAVTVTEEISGINIYPDVIRFMSGVGTVIDGVFTYTVPQQYSEYQIKENLYQRLMEQYPNGFVSDNLWEYVDMIRSGADSSAPSKYATWDSTTNTWIDPANILELQQADAVLEVDSLASVKILATYPLYKQNNISRTPLSDEAVAMYAYIDNIRALAQTAKTNINAAPSVVEIRAAVSEFKNSLELI
jgi:hypothetical protein